MNNKRCDSMMDAYLALDKNERIPLALTLHLLSCRNCRTQVRMMTLAEKLVSRPLQEQTPFSDAGIAQVMRTTDKNWTDAQMQTVTLGKWIFGGILMIVCLLVFAVFHHSIRSATLQMAFYLMFAISVSAYCAIFVAANLDFFVKKIR